MHLAASVLACLLAFLALLTIAGFLYQRIGAHRDRARHTREGRWIEISQHCQLYLVEKGTGGPTVIFESGIGATNLNWHHIQAAISRFTHTLSYDRAGLGWSSPSSSARTPANIAPELHTMLQNAGIKPPYLLVGHSFGGLVMRRYALLYPQHVLGMVLIDPMRPEDWPPFNPAQQPQLNRGMRLANFGIPLAHCGLARLALTSLLCRPGHLSDFLAGRSGHRGMAVFSRIKEEVSKMPPEVWPMVAAHWSRPVYYAGMRSHLKSVPDTACEMKDAQPIRSIPITLLTPGTSTPLGKEELSRIGDHVHQILAPACAHWIHLDDPALIVETIRESLAAITSQAPTATVGLQR